MLASVWRCLSRWPIIVPLLAVFLSLPMGSAAQTRWRAVSVQAGFALGSAEFAGAGPSVAVELGIWEELRVFAQWNSWGGIGCGPVLHGPNPCSIESVASWELGFRQGLGVSPDWAPFIGVGLGLYRQRAPSSDDSAQSLSLSVAAGVDFPVRRPVTIRWSLAYQEILDRSLAGGSGSGVRYVSILLGLSLATW